MVVKDELVGLGEEARVGQTIVFDYRGFIFDENAQKNLGKEFDSSYRRNEPMKLVLGADQQIKGLDEGIVGMKAGGQRYIKIKPSKAYMDKDVAGGTVPAGATLIYLIELRSIQN